MFVHHHCHPLVVRLAEMTMLYPEAQRWMSSPLSHRRHLHPRCHHLHHPHPRHHLQEVKINVQFYNE